MVGNVVVPLTTSTSAESNEIFCCCKFNWRVSFLICRVDEDGRWELRWIVERSSCRDAWRKCQRQRILLHLWSMQQAISRSWLFAAPQKIRVRPNTKTVLSILSAQHQIQARLEEAHPAKAQNSILQRWHPIQFSVLSTQPTIFWFIFYILSSFLLFIFWIIFFSIFIHSRIDYLLGRSVFLLNSVKRFRFFFLSM